MLSGDYWNYSSGSGMFITASNNDAGNAGAFGSNANNAVSNGNSNDASFSLSHLIKM